MQHIFTTTGALLLAATSFSTPSFDRSGHPRPFIQESGVAPIVQGLNGLRAVQIEDHSGPVSAVNVPIDEPGDIGWARGALFLCGSDNSTTTSRGTLALLNVDSFGFYTLSDVYTDDGSHFAGVVYDPAPGILYVLDCAGDRIISARYNGGTVLPTTWSTVATVATVPELDLRQNYKLRLDDCAGAKKLVLVHANAPISEDEIRIDVATLATTVIPGAQTGIDEGRLEAGQTSVDILGCPSSLAVVVRMSDQAIIGAAFTDAMGHAAVPTSPLLVGEVYAARDIAEANPGPPFLSPATFTGTPEALSNGASIVPMGSHVAQRMIVGNPFFTTSVRINDPVRSYAGTQLAAALVLSTPNLISTSGGRTLLSAGSILFSTVGFLDVNSPVGFPSKNGMAVHGYGEVRFPIPATPALAGVDIALQWYVQDTNGVLAVSDVVHAPVRAARWIAPGTDGFFQ